MSKHHDHFMRRCIELARRGRGNVGNGAMVGALLVRDRHILAEAHHAAFGEPHAERLLLNSFHGNIRLDDILYVNLEPCCHVGKTPPCTDVILERGIRNVVFGMVDPDNRVRGKGIETLREANINVIGPVLPIECARLNRGYVSTRTKGRPWITLKRAQTRDGSALGKITSEEQDAWSHEFLRGRHDAILVGVETIVKDNPELTVRFGYPTPDPLTPTLSRRERGHFEQPCRVILDPHGRMPNNAKVLADGGRTIVVTGRDVSVRDGAFVWADLWEFLEGITSILVEGGPRTWEAFRKAKMMDEEVILTNTDSTGACRIFT